MNKVEKNNAIAFRTPQLDDAASIYRLIGQCKPLDVNSEYLYMLLSSHFRETCVLACQEGEVVALTTAYIIPNRPNTLFIWQIAVSEKARKRGIAKSMLRELLKREVTQHVQFLEATVSLSNEASLSLFHSFSEELKTEIKIEEFIKQELFVDPNHASEDLIKVGPIKGEQSE